MQAGRLRHRVTVEELITDLDSDGATLEAWYPIGPPLSAEILPLSGRELIAADAVQSKVTTRIRIRYRPGIIPSMRAVHREEVYNIEAVIPDNNSGIRWLTLQCTSGVNDG
jgi:SPP1 family predicted phage head-tail adaptor